MIHLSGYAAGHQKGSLATAGLQRRAPVYTTRHANCFVTRREHLLTEPKPFCRAGSTLSAKPITSTLPTTISGDATVAEVAALLRAHREDIEAFSKSPTTWRELAVTRNVGIQALTWLQQLEGLDEQHVISKKLCMEFGWLLVAEGNVDLMISWLVEESSRLKSSQDWVKPSRSNYHDEGAYGNRTCRRHDQLAGLINGHVILDAVDDAVKSLSVTVRCVDQVGGRFKVGTVGAQMALERAIQSIKATPCSVSGFESFLELYPFFDSSEKFPEGIAFTKLFHPAAPDPWAAYLDMGRFVGKAIKANQIIKPSRGDKFGWLYVRAMFILHLQGAVAEANAVSQVLQEHFARVWRKRHPQFARLKKDPKLQKLLAQYRNGVKEGRLQEAFLKPRSGELNGSNTTAKKIDDMLAKPEPEPEIEESEADVSSKLLELRSLGRR